MNRQIQNICVDRTGSFLSPVLMDISVLHPAVKSWRTTVSSQPPESCKQRRIQVRQFNSQNMTSVTAISNHVLFACVAKDQSKYSFSECFNPALFYMFYPPDGKERGTSCTSFCTINTKYFHVNINCFKTNNGQCTQRKSGASISFKTNHGQKIGVCFDTL